MSISISSLAQYLILCVWLFSRSVTASTTPSLEEVEQVVQLRQLMEKSSSLESSLQELMNGTLKVKGQLRGDSGMPGMIGPTGERGKDVTWTDPVLSRLKGYLKDLHNSYNIAEQKVNMVQQSLKKLNSLTEQLNLNFSTAIEELSASLKNHLQEFNILNVVKGSRNSLFQYGDPGKNGRNGLKGVQGLFGDRGEPGLTGLPGPDGSKGQKGETGLPGIPGIPGDPGYKGERGRKGMMGLPAVAGQKGVSGEKGQKGDMGDPPL